MIRSLRSEALARLWNDADPRGIRHDQGSACAAFCSNWMQAGRPEDLNLPGYRVSVRCTAGRRTDARGDDHQARGALHSSRDQEKTPFASTTRTITDGGTSSQTASPASSPSIPERCYAKTSFPRSARPRPTSRGCSGVSRQALYDILSEKAPVSADMAVKARQARAATAPIIWINLQRSHDLWHAQRRTDVSKIPTLQAAE